MITIALARASRCCLLARRTTWRMRVLAPHRRLSSYLFALFYGSPKMWFHYIFARKYWLFVPPCEQRTKAKLMKISRDIIRFTMHSLCTFTAPYYYYYVLCGPWSVARSWHYLCHTAWLMLKLFFFYLTTRRWQHWLLWCGRQLLVFGNTFLLLY